MQAKGLKPSFAWQDIVGEEHNTAFTVAKMMDLDLLTTVQGKLEAALDSGQSLQEFKNELIPTLQKAGWWGKKDVIDPLTGDIVKAQLGSASRLETIFRSNIQSAYSVGHWDSITRSAKTAPYLMYDSVDDFRTRPEHAAFDGKVYPVHSDFWRSHFPPNGFNCFAPWSTVSLLESEVQIAYRIPYQGPLFKIRTRNGAELTVTAYHPIRTPDGWIPAISLKEGHQILCDKSSVEAAVLEGETENNAQSTAEQIFHSVCSKRACRRFDITDLDFYGDGQFSEGYVDVININGFLRGKAKAGSGEVSDNFGLIAAGVATRDFGGNGLFTLCLDASGEALVPSSDNGGSTPVVPYLGDPLGSSALPDTRLSEPSAESGPWDAVPRSEIGDTFPGGVFIDDVVEINSSEHSGHVYDFQTVDGYIVADGVITANCRCGVIQLDDDDLKDMGLRAEPPTKIPTREWKNPRTKTVKHIPVGIDPGWDHHPGKARLDHINKLADEKAGQLAADQAKAMRRALRNGRIESERYRRELDLSALSGIVPGSMESPITKIERTNWEGSRQAAILAKEKVTKEHADYRAAKRGDIDAASRLVADLMATKAALSKIERQVRKTDPIVTPVHALEGLSYNVIPTAMSEYIALRLGLRTNFDILQANRVGHTGSSGYHRLANPALFTGDVIDGEEYLLVDDFLGQGGTIASLRGHIESGGGNVVGIVSLTGQRRSAILAVTTDTLEKLREKHEGLESWWEGVFGYGFESLTESEARYLHRSPDADTIRDRLVQAAREAGGSTG